MSGSDIQKLAFRDRTEIIGAALAMAAGRTPAKAHPWAKNYAERGDMSLAGIMASLGQPVSGFMTSADLRASIEETIRHLALEAQRDKDVSHRRLTRMITVPDLRTTAVVRHHPTSLVELGEGAEVPALPMSIAEGRLQGLKTFGGTMAMSRRFIVDAEWSLVNSIVEELLDASYRAEASAVYDLLSNNPALADGKTLFHPDRGNIAAAGGAPSLATLESAITALANLSVDGVRLGLRPWCLVAPVNLAVTVAAIFEQGASRLFPGGFTLTPELPGTQWFVLPDPNLRPVLGLIHLNNGTEPTIDMSPGFRSDAMHFRVRHTFGVAPLSPYCVVNPGQ